MIGIGSMVGGGIFAVLAPAAHAAGPGMLLAVVLAAVVAALNATACVQLAAVHPTSGGVYAYGRAEIGPWWGYLAGWSFAIGNTASCAAIALTLATYAAPEGWERPVAVVAVLTLGALTSVGVHRAATVTRALVLLTLLALGLVTRAAGEATPAVENPADLLQGVFGSGPLGVLQAAGLFFFAFAGYARVTTLGEEVEDPARTIPRAVALSLGVVTAIYLALSFVVLRTLGPEVAAASTAPLADVVAGTSVPVAVVTAGAVVACLGALLGLLLGVGRTIFAMAREGDLPSALARVHPAHGVPRTAQLWLTVVVAILTATLDLRGAIAFAAFGVLLYYAVANLAALRQTGAARRTPRALQVAGIVGCLVLAFTLPWQGVVGGVVVLGVGVLVRVLVRR